MLRDVFVRWEVIWSRRKDISPRLSFFLSFFLTVCLESRGVEFLAWLHLYSRETDLLHMQDSEKHQFALPYLGKMNLSWCLRESGWKSCHFPRCCLITKSGDKLTWFNEQRTDGCCDVTARYLLQAAADQSAAGKTLNFSLFCVWISSELWKNQWRQRRSENWKGINN